MSQRVLLIVFLVAVVGLYVFLAEEEEAVEMEMEQARHYCTPHLHLTCERKASEMRTTALRSHEGKATRPVLGSASATQ